MAAKKSAGQSNIVAKANSSDEDYTSPEPVLAMEMSPEEEIAELKAQLERQAIELAEARSKKADNGLCGWIITTPNMNFSGITAGVKFKNGRGFIAGKDEEKAMRLCADFGYERRFSENFFDEAGVGDEVAGTLIDVLSRPVMK